MLFLVISTPRRAIITPTLLEARLAFRKWIKSLGERVVCFYPREDRGAIIIFDLASRRALDAILRGWRAFIPVRLDVYPLQDPTAAETLLRNELRRLAKKEK